MIRRPLTPGATFGRWTVTGTPFRGRSRMRVVPCVCACGVTGRPTEKALLDGSSLSCGCLRDALNHVRPVARVLGISLCEAALRAWAATQPVTVDALRSALRHRSLVAVRHAACAHLHSLGFSLTEIGHALGRDHSTVLHGLRAHARRVGLTKKEAA